MEYSSNRARDMGKAVGHYLDPLWPIAMVTSSFVQALLPDKTTIAQVASWSYMTIFLTALACNLIFHSGKLCELCARAVPIDPQAAIERDDRWLRLSHYIGTMAFISVRGRNVPVPLRLFVILIGGSVISLIIQKTLGLDDYQDDWLNLLTMSLPIAAVFWSGYRHNRLQPWCPYCHPRRGKDDEEVVEPEPDPAIGR